MSRDRTGRASHARRLRRSPTPSEARAWDVLRANRSHGLHFRRQHPLHGRVVDVYCARLHLAIEIDGGPHAAPGAGAHDASRDSALLAHGIRTIRIPASAVEQDPVETLSRALSPHLPPHS